MFKSELVSKTLKHYTLYILKLKDELKRSRT